MTAALSIIVIMIIIMMMHDNHRRRRFHALGFSCRACCFGHMLLFARVVLLFHLQSGTTTAGGESVD